MEPNVGGDDARKKRQSKRDCAEVVEHKTRPSSKLRKYSPTATDEPVVKAAASTSVKVATSTSTAAAAATDVPASVTKAAAANEQANASVKATPQSPVSDLKEGSTNETTIETTTTREAVKHPAAAVKTITTVGKQDLESALHYVVTIGEGRSEPLSDDTTLSFRVGHAGDASTLATWYRNTRSIGGNVNNKGASSSSLGSSATTDSPATATDGTDEHTKENSPSKTSVQQPATNTDETPSSDPTPTTTTTTCLDQGGSSSLDLWLVDGLGDEDIPPSLFALIADVNATTTTNTDCNATKTSPKMAAVALLTSSWENSSRVLRLEWFQIDDSSLDQSQSKLIERRMWLRLSLLSLVTSSELRVVDPSTNFNALTAATATTTTTTTTQVSLQSS